MNGSREDSWAVNDGRVVMSGMQAVARMLLAQSHLDERRGLNTAGFISGYRGSPLGGLDTALWSVASRLDRARVVFQAGLNEELAATAVRGTQQLEAVPGARYEGVFAAWYGKGPGVDRAGDALKHGNYAGTHPKGGVLVLYGDDHPGKSSTVAHQSEQALAACLIPSLYPANVQELFEFGLLGYALSRHSGSWVGIKCVNEVAEQTSTLEISLSGFAPRDPGAAADSVHVRFDSYSPLRDEQVIIERRLPRVQEFVRLNRMDRIVLRARQPTLGIVTAGKASGDVRAALALLGLDDARVAASGISVYKVGCIWPLEPRGLTEFCTGLRTVLVVEEKKSFLEQQLAALLINRSERALVIGKHDEVGTPLLSSVLPLMPADVARAIAGRMERLGLLTEEIRAKRDALERAAAASPPAVANRVPFFCSGCPHSRSTRVPEGSLSMTGIGCHTMALFLRPKQALVPTHMGGEGGTWLGLAPFTNTAHIFQNMGDGTYYHSGVLAIRAAVAACVNITYKILYNDAVAMTGGQPVDGPLSVVAVARQLIEEGVKRVVIVSEDPRQHLRSDLPVGTRVECRDALDAVQRELREVKGCTVLIYEQTCAIEKRRRRKRGLLPTPPKRLFISKAVCEGCGDCSVQSTCASVLPVETAMGRKRAIDQSSCSQDFSCLNGFCPSFIGVYGGAPRRNTPRPDTDPAMTQLPEPERVALGDSSFNLLIAGVGGTGVVTVAAILGLAAHLEGLCLSLFDMTGLSQKNGAVYSHIRMANAPEKIHTQRLGPKEAHVLLAFDLVAALAAESVTVLDCAVTRVFANADVSPTLAFQLNRDFSLDAGVLATSLRQLVRPEAFCLLEASSIATVLLGESLGANLFLVGVAVQNGALPLDPATLERAIELNAVAAELNIRAFRLGRLFAVDPARVLDRVERNRGVTEHVPKTLTEILAHRSRHLTSYQNAALAERYRALVEHVRRREAQCLPGSESLACVVARCYARVLAYKDEYEVARLLSSPSLQEELRASFGKFRGITLNLAPPALVRGARPAGQTKREIGAWVLPLLRMLARLRGLRGTWLDPFRHTAERQMERALIREYEDLVYRVAGSLTRANHPAAVSLLELVDEVRGYGHVKQAALNAYSKRVSEAERAFNGVSGPEPPREDAAGAAAPRKSTLRTGSP
jgi:indolepyruvate ferredoxin oxidoreductase